MNSAVPSSHFKSSNTRKTLQPRPYSVPRACLDAYICLGQALVMQSTDVWIPALRVGLAPAHANAPRRPSYGKTKMNRVSPRPGSHRRMMPLLMTRCGVPELGYFPNQTAAPNFLALQPRATKHWSLHGVSLAPGCLHPKCKAGYMEKRTKCAGSHSSLLNLQI
jgi:hypothetical protein